MRSTMIMLVLAALVSACSGSVTDARSASSDAVSSGAGGEGGSSSDVASSSSSGTLASGGGGGPPLPAPQTCSFGVAGAIEAWLDGTGAQAFGTAGGWIGCSAITNGYTYSMLAHLGEFHGPGQYVALFHDSLSRYQCPGDCTTESFVPKEVHCAFELTVAPFLAKVGDPVAGTFHCDELVDESDATSVVSVHDGVLSGVIHPEPD